MRFLISSTLLLGSLILASSNSNAAYTNTGVAAGFNSMGSGGTQVAMGFVGWFRETNGTYTFVTPPMSGGGGGRNNYVPSKGGFIGNSPGHFMSPMPTYPTPANGGRPRPTLVPPNKGSSLHQYGVYAVSTNATGYTTNTGSCYGSGCN